MDYRAFVQKHRDSGAAITIAALPCAEKEASQFGVMKIDASGRVTDFAEKPKGEALRAMRVDTTSIGVDEATAKEKPYIASMGIYGERERREGEAGVFFRPREGRSLSLSLCRSAGRLLPLSPLFAHLPPRNPPLSPA